MSGHSPHPPPSDWQHEFKVAVSSGQIQAAKAAIFARLKAKAEHPPSVLERIALNDAIHLLRMLRGEHLPSPTRKTTRVSR